VIVVVMTAQFMMRFVDDRAMAFGRVGVVMRNRAGRVIFSTRRWRCASIARTRAAESDQARQNSAEQRQEDDGTPPPASNPSSN
jgi:hypothetical protein